jgi:hypothetical protein
MSAANAAKVGYNALILLSGAPEGIRTLDSNLGKWRGIHALCSPSGAGLPAGRAAQSGGWPIFSAIDAPIRR